MKLPFFREANNNNTDLQTFRIVVTLCDWCPACLEYKVVLNWVLSSTPIRIEFVPPSKLNEHNFDITAIPTTFFIKDESVEIKQISGFLTCNQFLYAYIKFRDEFHGTDKELISK